MSEASSFRYHKVRGGPNAEVKRQNDKENGTILDEKERHSPTLNFPLFSNQTKSCSTSKENTSQSSFP